MLKIICYNKTVMEQDVYKKSRGLYIVEAMVEYFISLMVAGAFLAKLTTAIGLSDSLTGILSSFVSLGCTFQIVALFLANKQPVKKWVTVLHTLNQLFFALVYFVPFIKVTKTVKVVAFIVLLLLGHAINNIVNSPKINWYMTLVDDAKRSVFTANKEIVSLIGGVLFSMGMGSIIDIFEESGNDSGALVFCGLGVFGLMVLHTVVLLFSKEKTAEIKLNDGQKNQSILGLFKNKALVKVVFMSVIWYIAQYATVPFYGTYQIKELGFSMLFVTILSSVGAICRALCSRPLGKFADKSSFVNMLSVCYTALLLSYLVNIFTVPSNGKVFFAVYTIFNSIAMAGVNSGEINLVYDFVDKGQRVGALALKSAISGIVGFVTTLLMSLLVERIQANGNTLLGISVYAQQVVSLIGAIVVAVGLVYLNLIMRKLKKPIEEQS